LFCYEGYFINYYYHFRLIPRWKSQYKGWDKDITYGISYTLEMGPDPTRAYFWPAANKRLTRLWHGYFLTRPDPKRFFWSKGKKIENFDIFRGNFTNSNPSHKWLTRPDPGQKFLTRSHHYYTLNASMWFCFDTHTTNHFCWTYFFSVI